MSQQVLDDILELEDWLEYYGGVVGLSGNPDLISGFDYSSAAQLTVGEFLSLLDEVESVILAMDWNAIKQQILALLDDPILSGQFTAQEEQEIRQALDLVSPEDLTEGFDLIRSEFAGIASSTLVVDAIQLAGGGSTAPMPTPGDDVIVGGVASDDYDLGDGNDAFWAGQGDVGDDTVLGGNGDDTMGGGVGNDRLDGDAGNDVMFGGAGLDEINAGTGDDIAWAGNGDDAVYGGEGNDTMGGGAGGDLLDGQGGDDLLYGGSDASADVIRGGTGNDTMFGGGGNDELFGQAGNDLIFNGGGADTVDGGDGDDTIWGGPGDDLLIGGAGADQFAFASGNGADEIEDFSFADGDMLNLEAFGFDDTSAVISAMSDTGGNVVLDLGSGQTVTIVGVSVADFTSDPSVFMI